jgi:hypothetical protein
LQFLTPALGTNERVSHRRRLSGRVSRRDLLAAIDPAGGANAAGRERSRRAALRAMQVGKLEMHPLFLSLQAMHLRVKAHLFLP